MLNFESLNIEMTQIRFTDDGNKYIELLSCLLERSRLNPTALWMPLFSSKKHGCSLDTSSHKRRSEQLMKYMTWVARCHSDILHLDVKLLAIIVKCFIVCKSSDLKVKSTSRYQSRLFFFLHHISRCYHE